MLEKTQKTQEYDNFVTNEFTKLAEVPTCREAWGF